MAKKNKKKQNFDPRVLPKSYQNLITSLLWLHRNHNYCFIVIIFFFLLIILFYFFFACCLLLYLFVFVDDRSIAGDIVGNGMDVFGIPGPQENVFDVFAQRFVGQDDADAGRRVEIVLGPIGGSDVDLLLRDHVLGVVHARVRECQPVAQVRHLEHHHLDHPLAPRVLVADETNLPLLLEGVEEHELLRCCVVPLGSKHSHVHVAAGCGIVVCLFVFLLFCLFAFFFFCNLLT